MPFFLTFNPIMMRYLASLLVCLALFSVKTQAQTFMEQVRKTQPGQGTVTVTQNPEIDLLVNGKPAPAASAEAKSENKKSHPTTQNPRPTVQAPHHTTSGKATDRAKDETVRHETDHTAKPSGSADTEEDIPVVDMRKKVMRGGYKVTGYRVQAYAGGNTRADRQEAERVRSAIKMKFPDQPVYVHFYSPRWICRVGNYRNYEEAAWMLGQLRKMGYKAATIVKGKITVQY